MRWLAQSINRIRLEFKGFTTKITNLHLKAVLIESDWNLKMNAKVHSA